MISAFCNHKAKGKMNTTTAAVAISIALCFILGCRNSPDSPTEIPFVIQGDSAAKAVLENNFISHAYLYYNSKSAYLFKLVGPAPGTTYSVLQITKDSASTYDMVLIDPVTQKPTTKIDREVVRYMISSFKTIVHQADN